LLTAANAFQYREVSLLLIVVFVIVLSAGRMSAALRNKIV
jgi:phosphonate transport system permease protein